jgi:hypothetical protein
MKMMKTLLAFVAGTSLIGASAVAQVQNKMQPVRPGGPQIQPPRPVKPVPPKPVKPIPPRPVKPVPPKPVKPRPPVHHHRPVVVHHHHQPVYHHGYGVAVLYSAPRFNGHYLTVRHSIPDLRRYGFNDRAYSLRASGRWQVCTQPYYHGHCDTERGDQRSFGNLAGRVSSIRYIGH